jgi:hypothetical protein
MNLSVHPKMMVTVSPEPIRWWPPAACENADRCARDHEIRTGQKHERAVILRLQMVCCANALKKR